MFVISDTSPILNLAVFGRTDLLSSLFGAIAIPPAVQGEFASLPSRYARFAANAPLPSFTRIEPLPSDAGIDALLTKFSLRLHPGEAEALTLAVALRADLFLVDELAARRLARRRGVPTLGTLGVILEAKRHNLLSASLHCLINLKQKLVSGLE